MKIELCERPDTPSGGSGGQAMLVLQDGTVFRGRGLGAHGQVVGEMRFDRPMAAFRESLIDPACTDRIVVLTHLHVADGGMDDGRVPVARLGRPGLVLREDVTRSDGGRAAATLDAWLRSRHIVAIAGLDTCALEHHVRAAHAPRGCLAFTPDGGYDLARLARLAAA